jgi:protein phosphatase
LYTYAKKTSVGNVRKVNEDSLEVAEMRLMAGDEEVNVFGMVVADGMGGYQAGEVASMLAKQCFLDSLPDLFSHGKDDQAILEFLASIFRKSNLLINQKATNDLDCRGMGTTLTLAVCVGSLLYVAHAGDSRGYIISKGEIQQITRDDSLVNELLEAGTITNEEAAVHPQKNIITKALGTEDFIEPQLLICHLKSSDIAILTSDGLTNFVADGDILQELHGSVDFDQSLANLVAMAENAGGFDNISITCCKYDDEVVR